MGIFLKGTRGDGTIDQDRTFVYTFRDESGGIAFDEATGEPVTATIRFVTRQKQRSLRKANTKRHARGGKMEEDFDAESFMSDLVDYMIVDWQHVRSDDDGSEVPCTLEMKLGLSDEQIADITELALQGQRRGESFRASA